MYDLISFEKNIQNIYRLSFPFIKEKDIQSVEDLRIPYLNFLESYQPRCPVNYSNSIFVADEAPELELKSAYAAGNPGGLIGEAFSMDEKMKKAKLVTKALILIQEMDEQLFSLFNLTIHSIFIRNVNHLQKAASRIHGGSSSSAIGVIWLTVNDGINEFDLAELLIHEMVHHLMFMDELNHPQFNYHELQEKGHDAHSPVLRLNRPLDKVAAPHYCSLRANTLLMIDANKTIHPDPDKMISEGGRLCERVHRLEQLDALLRSPGKELVNMVLRSLKTFS